MGLTEIKDWFKTNFTENTELEQVSINKIDNNKEKALCFYNSKRTIAYINKLSLSTYSIKPITILLRYAKNQELAEQYIYKLYNFFDKKRCKINGKNVKFSHCYENPINLGTDNNGIQEYSLEIDLYYEKEEKQGKISE